MNCPCGKPAKCWIYREGIGPVTVCLDGHEYLEQAIPMPGDDAEPPEFYRPPREDEVD